jgi:hypothetical protein
MTLDEFKQYLREKAQSTWDATQLPYMLARLSPELQSELKVNYRDLVHPQTLKAFAQGVEGIRVVQDPHRNPRVGIVPASAIFDFASRPPTESAPNAVDRSIPHRRGNTTALIRFLEALSDLDDDTLDAVQIPVKALVHLVRRK